MSPSTSTQPAATMLRVATHAIRESASLRPAGHAQSRTSQKISATILTKDSALRLDEVLTALRWCDEIVVLDTGSSDDTIAIAETHGNVCVHRMPGPFPGFGRAHQRATALARNDWILSIDSDEVVSAELAAEIAGLRLDPWTVYTLPFQNHFNGRQIRSCGWCPDRHERLFNRSTTKFSDSGVHERVETRMLTVRDLKHPVHHYSYVAVDDFLRKMRTYSQLFAVQYAGNRSSGPLKAVTHSAWAFVRCYFFQRGFLEGYEGLVISVYNAQTVFWKYLFLHEANQRRG